MLLTFLMTPSPNPVSSTKTKTVDLCHKSMLNCLPLEPLHEYACIPSLKPGEGNGNPLQYSCLENTHGRRSLAGYSPRGRKRVGHDSSDLTYFSLKGPGFSAGETLLWERSTVFSSLEASNKSFLLIFGFIESFCFVFFCFFFFGLTPTKTWPQFSGKSRRCQAERRAPALAAREEE